MRTIMTPELHTKIREGLLNMPSTSTPTMVAIRLGCHIALVRDVQEELYRTGEWK